MSVPYAFCDDDDPYRPLVINAHLSIEIQTRKNGRSEEIALRISICWYKALTPTFRVLLKLSVEHSQFL
jgi:hypothetical protein